MTREEAIAIFKGFKFLPREMEAVEMAMNALEQEPCEDCISREQAIKATYGFERYTGIDEAPYEYAESILRDLPPVTPTRKKGKWIKHKSNMTCEDVDNFYDEDWDGTHYECSSCHTEYFYMTDFCPNCGADMRGGEDGSN